MATIAPYFALQFFDNDGAALSGGKVYTYAAGTLTPKATYTTEAGTVANANPIILDSAGRASIFRRRARVSTQPLQGLTPIYPL